MTTSCRCGRPIGSDGNARCARRVRRIFPEVPEQLAHARSKGKWRSARDRLSEHSYRVGLTYFRIRWDPGAIDRFREVLRDDPAYPGRDAVYFYLAESLARSDKTAEAIPYLERLLSEFEASDAPERRAGPAARLKNQ